MILFKKGFGNDFHFVATQLIAYNVPVYEKFCRPPFNYIIRRRNLEERNLHSLLNINRKFLEPHILCYRMYLIYFFILYH